MNRMLHKMAYRRTHRAHEVEQPTIYRATERVVETVVVVMTVVVMEKRVVVVRKM